MIDSTSGNPVLKALGERLGGPEEKAKAAVVEKASKVGSVQHQAALNFLAEKLGQSLGDGQAPAASADVSAEETGKEAKKQNTTRAEASKAEGSLSSSSSAEDPTIARPPPTTTPPTTTPPTTTPPTTPTMPVPLPLDPPAPPPPQTLPIGFSLESIGAKESASHESTLTRIMAEMSELMADSALELVEANRKHQQQASKLSLESIRKRETDQIAEQKKADEAQKAASCIFQVVAAIISVAMLVFSVVTMNPAMIVMSVLALGLVVADAAMAAAGITTLSEMIFAPIMEYIIQPIADFIGTIITDILIAFGANEEDAKLAGMVLGLIFAIVLLIVVAVAARNSTVLKSGMSMVGSAFGKMLGKMTPTVVQQFAKTAAQGMSAGMKTAALKMNVGGAGTAGKMASAQALSAGETAGDAAIKASQATAAALARAAKMTQANVQIGFNAASLGGGVAGGSASVAGSVYEYEVQMLIAELVKLFASITTNSDMLKDLQTFFNEMMRISTELMETALDAQGSEQSAAKHILSQMSRGI